VKKRVLSLLLKGRLGTGLISLDKKRGVRNPRRTSGGKPRITRSAHLGRTCSPKPSGMRKKLTRRCMSREKGLSCSHVLKRGRQRVKRMCYSRRKKQRTEKRISVPARELDGPWDHVNVRSVDLPKRRVTRTLRQVFPECTFHIHKEKSYGKRVR